MRTQVNIFKSQTALIISLALRSSWATSTWFLIATDPVLTVRTLQKCALVQAFVVYAVLPIVRTFLICFAAWWAVIVIAAFAWFANEGSFEAISIEIVYNACVFACWALFYEIDPCSISPNTAIIWIWRNKVEYSWAGLFSWSRINADISLVLGIYRANSQIQLALTFLAHCSCWAFGIFAAFYRNTSTFNTIIPEWTLRARRRISTHSHFTYLVSRTRLMRT